MKKNILLLYLALLGLQEVSAQQATTASGGDGSGSGGSVAYSLGQVVYTEMSGTGGSSIQGAQQPYEIFMLGNHAPEPISLIMKVYPNPTLSDVVLLLGNMALDGLDYILFDIQGRSLHQGRITENETTIPMERHPRGTYLLTVRSNGKTLKTFKILKNAL